MVKNITICALIAYALFAFVCLDLFWWANEDWYFARMVYPLTTGVIWSAWEKIKSDLKG